ncbi:MAG: hypothetical protein JO187_06990, partial [Acidobacteria bacterium]|nr:hypothetical protein [Acidobacteriota bacterium]
MQDDDSFVADVEACCYPGDRFTHVDHIRLAWIYLRRYGAETAAERIRTTIQRFAHSLGQDDKYHETITQGWLRLVAAAARLTPELTSFDKFIEKHGWLLDRDALKVFYTPERLASEEAKRHPVEP